MTKTLHKIDMNILDILAACTIDGNNVRIASGQLDRATYQQVNKVLDLMGGKWNRSAKAHVFSEPPTDLMDTVLLTGEITDTKKLLQQFFTPQEIALRMVKFANIRSGDRILEPSAGSGSLLRATGYVREVRDGFCETVAIELDSVLIPALCETARDFGSPYTAVKQGNFLHFNNSPLSMAECVDIGMFEVIVMNPPFTRGQDISHIKHAVTFLNPGGRLVAICGNSPKQQEALKPIADHWEDLPSGTFAESGTNVNTALLVVRA